jgi:hypothetical protein
VTQLTAHGVASYWLGAGGPRSRMVEWVAIALGESSYNTDAISIAGAIGLWQIMPFNAAPNGVSVNALYDPHWNAYVAVRMSGHGTNCAAWDSAYRDIAASGRYSFLGWPESGSADFNNLAIAANELGGHAVAPAGSGAPGYTGPSIVPAMHDIEVIRRITFPRLGRTLLQQRAFTNRAFKNGWHP